MIRTFLLATALSGAAAPAFAEAILGVRADNQFVRFDSATPGNVTNLGFATGLMAGEAIIGIDSRPANGQIFALTSQNRLYSVTFGGGNPLATQVGTDGQFTLGDSTAVGFDFNPLPDRIRVVGPTDQNLRLNPNNGALAATDGALRYDDTAADGDPIDVNAGVNPNIVAAGYTNSFAPSPRPVPPGPGTTLYVIDSNLDILAIQAPPNDGILNTVGSLGADVGELASFDISGATGIAYLLEPEGGPNSLYTVSLATGLATFIGSVAGGPILAITVADVPAPGGLALFGLSALGFALARRR